MEINAVNSSNNFLTNVDPLVFNQASAAADKNIAQASDPIKFEDTIELSATANAIVEWISLYKKTLGSHIGVIQYMNVDSDVGQMVDEKLLDANKNLLSYLESASVAEKSSEEYQDYVNRLRLYIAKIQEAFDSAKQETDENTQPVQAANSVNTNNAEVANENAAEKPKNISLSAFLSKSMGEFRNKLKEFLLAKRDVKQNDASGDATPN